MFTTKIIEFVLQTSNINLSGAAPISNEVLNFMRCALGVYFSEGYGQTEATCAICVTLPG